MELLSFKQDDGEPLVAAWARFMQSVTSRPPHNVQEGMLMQHFRYGLNPESTHFMNLASEGSVMYKKVAEVRTILEMVLSTTQYIGVFDDPPKPEDQPKEKQQLHILSATSSPRPPHIEEITEPPKSLDHEPLIEYMPMFITDLFTEKEYMELGNVSAMPKEHKFICSRFEVFILEVMTQVEGLSAIMSKEWTEETKSCSSIIQIYHNPIILFCTIWDAISQEIF